MSIELDLNADQLDQLDRLCWAVATSQATPAQRQELEQLLLGSPERQARYCRWVLAEELLHSEFAAGGHSFAALELEPGSAVAPPVARPALPPRRPAAVWRRHGRRGVALLAVATVAAAVWVAAGIWQDGQARRLVELSRSAPSARLVAMHLPNAEAIGMLHRVTRTERPEPVGPGVQDAQATVELSRGIAELLPFNGAAAGGYVAVLPPRALLSLSVYADSEDNNTLTVLELDRSGRPTGQLVSFSNHVAGNEDPSTGPASTKRSPIYGELGTWSVRNEHDRDQYFLIIGLQQVATPDPANWYVADFSVLVNQTGLIHLGWDDSGWVDPGTGLSRRDKDYNDITATVEISLPSIPELGVREIEVVPGLDYPRRTIELPSEKVGFPVTVPPGAGLICDVASDARDLNAISIVDATTGEIWWHRTNEHGKRHRLGAFVVRNRSATPVQLRVIARHWEEAADETDAGYFSESKLLVNSPRCQTIGFEDRYADEDWNDVRVNLHWLDH